MKNIHGFPTYVLVPDFMGPRKLLIVRTSHFSEILTPDTLFPSKKLIISPMYIYGKYTYIHNLEPKITNLLYPGNRSLP